MDVILPNLGDGVESANVLTVLVAEGETVAKDQSLIELETDKAVAPVPAPANGTLLSLTVKEGDTVKTGSLIGKIKTSDKTAAKAEPAPPAPAATPAPPQQIQATPVAVPKVAYQPQSDTHAPASPSIRKLAARIGLDLSRIPGTGRGGRIEIEDVQNFVAYLQSLTGQPGQPQVATEPAKPKIELPDFSKWGPVKTEKVSSLRQKIGEKMAQSWTTIPHVTQFEEADITEMWALRQKYNPKYKKKDARLTVTVFALKAVVNALKEFPQFNASYDEENGTLIVKQYYHIGVAVDTPSGLIVPVIKDIDKKSVLELSLELDEIAQKARDRKISLDDLQGGSFTISNLGSLGVSHFTPIVNHPEVAILGMARGTAKPVYIKGELQERMMLPLALSYDHRIIDGADGARFTKHIVTELESFPEKALKES